MVVIWAGLIYYLSTPGFGVDFTVWLLAQILLLLHLHVSPAAFEQIHFLFRKSAHMTEYGIFSLLLYASFQGRKEFEWNPRLALRCVLIAAAYSLTDEFHQLFSPGRGASLVDCGIDTTGAVLAILLVVYGHEVLVQAFRRRSAASAASAAET